MHVLFKSAALQMLRDDKPILFQGVHGMRCFMWQDDIMLMSRLHDAMKLVRAASLGVMSWMSQHVWL